MDNPRIQKRHLNASLLQLFMKHKKYYPDLLIFEKMDTENIISLVESLGNVVDFFENNDSNYGLDAFIDWCSQPSNQEMILEKLSHNEIDDEMILQWKQHFIDFLINAKAEVI